MSFSPVFKWLLVLLLPLSLAWKSAIAVRIDYSTNVEQNIVKFLARNHFNVSLSDQIMHKVQTYTASSFACRMLVTPISYRGWERDAVYNHATKVDQVFFVLGGKVYTEYPTWSAAFDFLQYKVLSELGFRLRHTSAIAVIASKSCDAERLPWYQLGSLKLTPALSAPKVFSSVDTVKDGIRNHDGGHGRLESRQQVWRQGVVAAPS